MEDFDLFHSNLDSTLSQITDINTNFSSDDEDDIFDFVTDNVSVSSNPTKKKFLLATTSQFQGGCKFD